MVIAGSQGHAHEVFEILKLNGYKSQDIVFFDDLNERKDIDIPGDCRLLQDLKGVKLWMKQNNNNYVYGLGGIDAKEKIRQKFESIGANLCSVIASTSLLGTEKTSYGIGIQLMHSTLITSRVKIGNHCLVNAGSKLMHDVTIGDNCNIAPGVIILGRATIGSNCFIGASATIMPDVVLGNNVTIGAGALVTNNLPSNVVAVGVPSKIIKHK